MVSAQKLQGSLGVLTMFGRLADWEANFDARIQSRERSKGASHAPLLPIVPDRLTWDAFLVSVRGEWRAWKSQLSARRSQQMVEIDQG